MLTPGVVLSLLVALVPSTASAAPPANGTSTTTYHQAGASPGTVGSAGKVVVGHSAKNDVSTRLRTLSRTATTVQANDALPVLPIPNKQQTITASRADSAVQSNLATPNMPATQLNFDGISYPGVICNCAPPDPNGEVGDTQYVQIVNEGLQVFDKSTGNSELGPISIASVWNGFGGVCETNGRGDPVVLYDQLANRWLISQFATTPATPSVPTWECVAVSTSDDATGTWNRYAFDLGSTFGNAFYDYPKFGMWPDAYYMSINVFNTAGTAFLGPQPFALDRNAMLAGNQASIISTGKLTSSDDQLMPADMDGSIAPPDGAPNPFTEIGTNPTWKLWRFHVDFTTPANSTFTQAGTLTPDPFTVICNGGDCVPQAGVSDVLATLGDRSMFRNAYRRFPDGHEALVGNLTVQSGGIAAIRWYEIDNATSGTPSFVQQSTYQPDDTWRWMGSAAMDAVGDLAIGFSASSSSIHPQVRYAGRLVGDSPNTLAQGEATLFAGTGSQTDTSSRWGDYSDLTVDPTDDCTFWYTNEYYATNRSFGWKTRIGNFKFPTCTTGPTGILTGRVTDATTDQPIQAATVSAGAASTITTADGTYSFTLPTDTYTVTASAFAYQSQSSEVTVSDGQTAVQDFSLAPPPGASLLVQPDSLDFGVVQVGNTTGPLHVTLTSTSADPVTVSGVSAPAEGFALAGGTCGAPPFTLSHLANCTLAYTFSPTVPGPDQTTVTITSNAPDSPHSITLHGNAFQLPQRIGATTLAAGEDQLVSAVIDPADKYAYFGTNTSPARIVKVDLSSFQEVGAITLAAGENHLTSAVIDPSGTFGYFGTNTSPGHVVKVDLSSFQEVGSITLASGEGFVESAVMDPAGKFAYVGTGGSPGTVAKIDLGSFQEVGAVTLATGENDLTSAVIDPGGKFAYFGTNTSPGRVAQIDLGSFQEVGEATLQSGEDALLSAVIDPGGKFAYFGTNTSPGRVVKIDLASLQEAGAVTLASGDNTLLSAVIDPAGQFAYFGTNTNPGRVAQIDLDSFQEVGAIALGSGEITLRSAAIDPLGTFAYFGTLSSPGRVVKVQIGPNIQLTANGQRDRGTKTVDLAWSGALASTVDIFRNYARIDTVANDGSYVDTISGNSSGSYTYQVCYAGLLICSNKATVRFTGSG